MIEWLIEKIKNGISRARFRRQNIGYCQRTKGIVPSELRYQRFRKFLWTFQPGRCWKPSTSALYHTLLFLERPSRSAVMERKAHTRLHDRYTWVLSSRDTHMMPRCTALSGIPRDFPLGSLYYGGGGTAWATMYHKKILVTKNWNDTRKYIVFLFARFLRLSSHFGISTTNLMSTFEALLRLFVRLESKQICYKHPCFCPKVGVPRKVPKRTYGSSLDDKLIRLLKRTLVITFW